MSFSSRWGNPTTLRAARAAPPLRGITSGPCCERPVIALTGLGREAALRGLSIDARLGKILEPANVEHCRVSHVLKRFPGQRRPTTRAAVQEDRAFRPVSMARGGFAPWHLR